MNGINAMTMNKIAWRRKSFLVLCYCLAFPDRANAGFAALQGRSNAAFDLGAGLLFLTGLRRRMIALAGPIFVVGLVVTKLAINEQKHTDRADEPVLSH